MKIKAVLSERNIHCWPSYHLIFEWEDEIAKVLHLPIVEAKPTFAAINFRSKRLSGLFHRFYQKVIPLIQLIDKYEPTHSVHLAFQLGPELRYSHKTSSIILPVIIDFWKQTDLEQFYRAYKNCKLILISSLEVYNYLLRNHCPIPLVHLPLSIADKHRPGKMKEKKYDIIIAGRGNQVLWQFLKKFSLGNPEVEYLYPEHHDGEFMFMSNKRGLIGNFHSRSSYLNLLRETKIAFYSTPGMDGGEQRTGGFNPVTPKFLELLAAQCLVIGRYPNNEETKFFELEKVVPNVNSFDHFSDILKRFLATDTTVPLSDYEAILDKHYTSVRAKQLVQIINTRN